MTKTAKQILTSLDKGEYLDKGGVDQALKEIEAIMHGVIGESLVDDITWSPTLGDPYGRRHMMDTTKTPIAKTNINHGSYETIKRQYQQLREALYRKEAEL